MTEAVLAMPATAKNSVLVRMAERFGVDANKLHATLKATAFKGEVSDAQFMALMIVADQYKLNPLTKEIYAFPDKNSGIVPVVGVDGWARIINEHPQFDGIEFIESPIAIDQPDVPAWIECVIYRKDRQHPTKVREYMSECKRSTGPWGSHPRRMLRHKSLIQCARLAFGFVGIYDQDEAERLVQGEVVSTTTTGAIADINAQVKAKPPVHENLGPSYAEVRQYIEMAKDHNDLDTAQAMVDGLPEQFRPELHELAQARREKLDD